MSTLKKSAQIELEACKEEDDWKAWALHAKAYKEAKKESFEDEVLPILNASDIISFVTNKGHFYKIGFKDGRIFDYYPIKNRLMRNKPSKWFSDGKNILLALIQPAK